ncbi:MAG: hypothetical protein ACREPF_02795 [Rhodanobacteraceae bacterium]
MAHQLSMRLHGDDVGIRALVTAIRGMPDVDGAHESGSGDFASRADFGAAGTRGLAGDCLDLRLDVPDTAALGHVRRCIETLAWGAGVTLDWLNEE